ncbi:MAG: bifunctional hydroxymethylpyrimidine kinase/phosphomethylpyrimidine kinase [Candidatus Lambdaproteobacteria bacterium RIFOXYD2_FULL_56_26]|uniref:hydroxymethylpyrimidine kinase n=1 Tax=Candidatus Lambdaproteobacteria bacterium RIFOXYD2_FULL_56_26 TaxID=1817773 RepID=A0A1F6GRP0_9PROT|nr:MAG: bifunctional hydroxymethylpyrimidine kinase/phosphomethylpyrimidine kinase [Candidatus Lambdaproteobacteria bacterium RIFOXYC1_FULL_56_13]OGH00718.1 MAG: bifunctional hydroxymethylpyrimidine kinase/phosphomethylpyrimidine kinase [Candidatus Lambdaproteobacteria bacterium RIFOXYD2_FULL_56_26]
MDPSSLPKAGQETSPKVALSFAGFDPTGGAGLLADLKVFEALGLWGVALPSGLTAQNSAGVSAVTAVELSVLRPLYQSLIADIPLAGVKLGMLCDRPQVELAVELLAQVPGPKVLDPVLVSSSGFALLSETGVRLMVAELLPLVDLITPNLREVTALCGLTVRGPQDLKRAAEAILRLGAKAVLVKGGHLDGEPLDLYLGPEGLVEFRDRRVEGKDPHGTGCLLSSLVLGLVLQGRSWTQGIGEAKQQVTRLIRTARPVGQGKPYWDLRSLKVDQ